jgi:protein tyrosine phosphatase
VQNAAQDAARYLSTTSVQEMKSAVLSEAAGARAMAIAKAGLVDLGPEARVDDPVVHCGSAECGRTGTAPTTVRVMVNVKFFDPFFGVVDTGRYGLDLSADVTLPHVGN